MERPGSALSSGRLEPAYGTHKLTRTLAASRCVYCRPDRVEFPAAVCVRHVLSQRGAFARGRSGIRSAIRSAGPPGFEGQPLHGGDWDSTVLDRALENPGKSWRGERVARPIGAVRTRRSGTGDDRCRRGFRGTARLDEPRFTRILFDTRHSAPGGSGFQQFRPRRDPRPSRSSTKRWRRDCGDRLRRWRVD